MREFSEATTADKRVVSPPLAKSFVIDWAPVGIACANVTYLVYAPAIGPIENMAELFTMGFGIAQPAVYAVWAAMSSSRKISRVLVAFLANTLAIGCFSIWSDDPSSVSIGLALFFALWVLLSEHRRRSRDVLHPQDSEPRCPSRSGRWGVADLLVLTTVAACWTAVFAWMSRNYLDDSITAPAYPIVSMSEHTITLLNLIVLVPFYALFLLPLIMLALATLKPSGLRPGSSKSAAIVAILVVAILAVVTVLAWQLVAAYTGAFVAIVGSAFLLRLAGYRITKAPRS